MASSAAAGSSGCSATAGTGSRRGATTGTGAGGGFSSVISMTLRACLQRSDRRRGSWVGRCAVARGVEISTAAAGRRRSRRGDLDHRCCRRCSSLISASVMMYVLGHGFDQRPRLVGQQRMLLFR